MTAKERKLLKEAAEIKRLQAVKELLESWADRDTKFNTVNHAR